MSDQARSEFQAFRISGTHVVGKTCEQLQLIFRRRIELVDDALVCIDQRHKLGQQFFADRYEIALALQHACETCEVGFQPVFFGVALRRQTEVTDHRIDVVLEFGDFAARFDLNGARQVALRHGRGDLGDGTHLVRQIVSEKVDVAGQVFPCTGGAGHAGLSAEAALDANFARHGRHLIRENRKRFGHGVDRVGERCNFAFRFDGELGFEITLGDCGHDLDDAANLFRQIRRHHVDGVGEIFPRATGSRNGRLTAELAFGADLSGDAGHFGGKAVQLIDHRVDGVFQLKNFAFDVDGDLA